MSDQAATDPEHTDWEPEGRQTAPQGPYTMRDVAVGFVVLVIGALVVFGIPLL